MSGSTPKDPTDGAVEYPSERLQVARGWNDPYTKVVGNSPFAKAVNKKMGDYWVETGREMPVENAGISVLADLYNTLASNLTIESALSQIE